MIYPVLSATAQHQIKNIGAADLVIGLPSYNNPQRTAQVAQIALQGAQTYFPDHRTVLINADAGRSRQTRQAVLALAHGNGHSPNIVSGRYEGQLGQGSATAALIDAALALDAAAIVILDSATDSISPEWVAGLAHLVLENKADLVLPRYRQWLLPEAQLNDLVAYPLFRALWGKSLRHVVAADFAISPALATTMLDEDVWGTSAATFGLMPWLATFGLTHNWRLAQSALSEKCLGCNTGQNDVRTRTPVLETARFRQQFCDVVAKIFRLMYPYRRQWQAVTQFQSLPTLTRFAATNYAQPWPEPDVSRLLDKLPLGWMEFRRLWQQILTPDNLTQLEALATLPPDLFYFPADLWARIVYDFAVAFNFSETDPTQIVAALLPIYQGRLAAFWQEIAGLALVGREGTVAAQAVEFEETRPYLKKQWHNHAPRRYLPGINNRSL